MEIFDDKHFLMIEPKCKPIETDDDVISKAVDVWINCKPTNQFYRGFHICSCGEISDNQNWLTPMRRITNNLMVHYIQYHRKSVPESELKKLEQEFDKIQTLGE